MAKDVEVIIMLYNIKYFIILYINLEGQLENWEDNISIAIIITQ